MLHEHSKAFLSTLPADFALINAFYQSRQSPRIHPLATLVKRIDEGKISGKSAKEILDVLVEQRGGDVDSLIDSMGLAQVNDDGAIIAAIESVLAANAEKVAEYKSGKDKLFGFFVGQVMKASKGANPARVNELLKEKLQ